MKKQLLAVAIGTLIAAPMAATAGDVTLYGKIHSSISSVDFDSAVTEIPGADMTTMPAGFDGATTNSHASRFGIKGTEDLGNGLSAFFQIENHFDAVGAGGPAGSRNTFVGLASSMGKLGIGDNDSPYKKSTGKLELFGDRYGDHDGIGFHNVRLEEQIFYYSPNWNGFSFGVGLGFHAEDTAATVDADGVEAVSVAGTYKNGPWFVSLAMEDLSQEGQGHSATVNGQDDEKWRLGLGWTANGYHVGFMYEDREDADGSEYDVWQLSGSYTFGNNVLKAAYGDRDHDKYINAVDTSDDEQMWTIGLDHKLSKRTMVYGLYTDFSDDAANSDWDAFSLGIIHKF